MVTRTLSSETEVRKSANGFAAQQVEEIQIQFPRGAHVPAVLTAQGSTREAQQAIDHAADQLIASLQSPKPGVPRAGRNSPDSGPYTSRGNLPAEPQRIIPADEQSRALIGEQNFISAGIDAALSNKSTGNQR